MTPNISFDFNSARAKKARFARVATGKAVKAIVALLAAVFAIGGLGLILVGSLVGWLFIAISAPFIMMVSWIVGELEEIPPAHDASVDSLLTSDILGALPKEYTVAELANIAMRTSSGLFFIARFEVGRNFFDAALPSANLTPDVVWQEAERIRQQLGIDHYSGVIVLAAIIRSVPHADVFLAQNHLDPDDMIRAAAWYHHIGDVIKASKAPKNDGGLGRDWSFGYTPMLSRFAANLSDQAQRGLLTRDVASHQAIVDRMIALFSQGGRQNAALIGPLGSGKTTAAQAMAKRLMEGGKDIPKQLRYQQMFALDPSTLIAQAPGRGELEGLIQQLFYEAFTAKNVILFLDDAHLFFEEGTGSVDLSNVLLPIIDGGALRIVLAMDEQSWLRISQRNAALAQHLNRVIVSPTNEEETMLIIEDQLILIEHRQKATYTYQSLQEAYRLADRHIKEQSMPGKALSLLESAGGFGDRGIVTAASVRQAIEQTLGIKVGTADTADERQTLLNLEDLLHERMINQTRAVKVVSDALRRARAGVRNQDRPIGTFLFLGPTGVGKTELSKALAAVFFGGEDHLIRIDLNEYVQPNDVSRLIAAAADDPHSLTAQIAKQPFSVVLLDEIEKAHPNVLNTLLQLLDEGILRDINNREVSFRDAIIIATSNAGADRLRQYIEAGWQLEDFEQRFTDELINSNQFRPEFLNRFDEIVLFRPLTPEELLQVINLILKSINKTLAAQKVSVNVDEDAKRFLVQVGYDPRLGARPMRRVVQRAVENIVAKRMLGGQVMPGEQIQISLQDVQSALGQ